MTKTSKFSDLVDEDALISVKETPIRMTDATIKLILWKVYERAQKDADKKRVSDYYDCCFSVFLTLLITLASATFHDLCGIDARFIEILAKVCLFVTGLGGLGLLLWNHHTQRAHDTSIRNDAVEEVLSRDIKGSQ